ncbi:MAG: ABC transporter permease [Colwellia sp.]|nr:ABC transporter permease [Colwellia sp.]
MNQVLATIPLTKLLIAFIPVFLVLVILARWSLPQKRTLHALARMLVQLLLVGYVLSYIFESDSAWGIGLLLLVMVFVSSSIALNNIEAPRKALFKSAFCAIFFSSVLVLFIISQGVLNLTPWYQAQTLVPLAGMVFANGMNSVSLQGGIMLCLIINQTKYRP